MRFDEDYRSKPTKHIVLIDDTLDMELNEHGLLRGESLGWQFRVGKELPVDLNVQHARDLEGAKRALEYLKEDRVKPEDITVISDYKLQVPGKPDAWGPDILTSIAANTEYRPKHLFMMSKSGFRGEDQPKLDAIGATYFHSNELLYMMADHAGSEAHKEVFSQRAKTHHFREWCNKEFGANYALGQYRSPDVKAVEKGRVPAVEVVRRLQAKTASHAEAMELLDVGSVAAAFHPHVDAQGILPQQTVAMTYGVEGPSVSGRLALSPEEALRMKVADAKAPVVLVLDHDYSPKDHEALVAADAVVMLKAGTQHIQVLAKNQHMPVLFANRAKYPDVSVKSGVLMKHQGLLPPTDFAKTGEWVTVDGINHTLYAGKLPVKKPDAAVVAAAKELSTLGDYHNRMTWHFKNDSGKLVDHTGVRVMANADNAQQVAEAKKYPSVRGIGLLRTEHMFLSNERRELLLRALLAEGENKKTALSELTALHTKDLGDVLAQSNKDFPVTIRLFDFPPAEFFPAASDAQGIHALAGKLQLDEGKLKAFCARVHKEDLRGAAFSLAFAELHQAQCEAIFAASAAHPQAAVNVMVPVVRDVGQIHALRGALDAAANLHGHKPYRLGAMIETRELIPEHYAQEQYDPIQAVARQCDFVSFGSNDLTQELLGVKRGDLQGVLQWNHESREPINPFTQLSKEVRNGMEIALHAVRAIDPRYDIGWCGDQAGTREGANFAQRLQINSMSVPATEDAVCKATVETGRAALLESTAQSEQRDRDHRERTEGELERKEGKLPEGLVHVSKHVLEKSPVAFVIMEDDHHQIDSYIQHLSGQPIIICDNVSDALKAIEAMHKKGKQVHAYLDANVPLHHYKDTKIHPLCDDVTASSNGWDRRSRGAALTWLAADGKIEGITPDRMSILSAANSDEMPKGAKSYSKGYRDDEDWLDQEMTRIVQKAQAVQKGSGASKSKRVTEPKVIKTVIILDDDKQWLEQCKQDIEKRFGCKVEAYSDMYEAYSRLNKGGVTAALIDQMMPDCEGIEFARAIKETQPDMPVAVITSSDAFVQEHAGQGDILVMHKNEAAMDKRREKGNRFQAFIRNALAGHDGPSGGMAA